MIELANSFDRFLQVLVIAQPAANLGNPFVTHAQLPGASTRVAHRQNKDLMPFAARAFWAAFGIRSISPVTGGLLTRFSRA